MIFSTLAPLTLTRRVFIGSPHLMQSKGWSSRVSYLAKRSYSNKLVPFQTPLVGDSDWKAMLKNIDTYNNQPPLFQTETKKNMHIYELEKRMEHMDEMMQKRMEHMDEMMQEIFHKVDHIDQTLAKRA